MIIDSPNIKFGMIRFGCTGSQMIHPVRGVYMHLAAGATIVFKGRCVIGNNSSIIVERGGILTLGNLVYATSSLNIICSNSVTINDECLLGWNNTIQDNNYHRLKDMNGNYLKKETAISIGRGSWITTNICILPGVKLPSHSVVATGAIVTRDFSDSEGYILLAGCPAVIVKRGVWLDIHDN